MSTAAYLKTTTPYHRIISPTLSIPTDSHISIPVGILACQRDPLLRELDTTVVGCSISQQPAPIGNKAKKLTPSLPNDPILEVILHDTVIFPEGGGQPSDIGLVTTADGQTWEVMQVKRHGGHAVHYVRITGDVDAVVRGFSVGTKVTVALGEDGFNRRYDHMSMHTSQHLLSALLETHFDLPTLSWSLTSYPTPCYVEIPRRMTAEEIAFIQKEASRLASEGRQVHVEVEELYRDLGKEVPILENGRSVGKALPADYTGGVKRVVVIDGVDRNPCCGTHLPTINNLQLFLLPHTDTVSRSASSSVRLYFLAGPRLIAHLTSTHILLTTTASILSCGSPLVPERVGQAIEECKRAEKRVESVEVELAEFIAGDLVRKTTEHGKEGVPFAKHVHRTDDSATALGFLSLVSSTFYNMLSAMGSPNRDYLLVLSSSPSSQTTSSTSVVLVVGSDVKKVEQAGIGLKAKLGVKGGGKGPKWSGKFIGVWKDNRENVAIDDLLKTIT